MRDAQKEALMHMEDDPEFEELKKSLFQEVKFVHQEMQKFEDLFRPSLNLTQTKIRNFPDRVYLIEHAWWQRWMEVSKYLIYRRMLRDQAKPTINKEWDNQIQTNSAFPNL